MDFKFWEFYRRYGLIFVLNLIPYCSRRIVVSNWRMSMYLLELSVDYNI